MPSENGKYVSGHLRNKPTGHAGPKHFPGGGKESKDSSADLGKGTAAKSHTEPHPATGVHKMEIQHHGGGRFTSHTHHDGGHVEMQNHDSEPEMHAKVQENFPADQSAENNAPEPMSGDLGGLGGEAV